MLTAIRTIGLVFIIAIFIAADYHQSVHVVFGELFFGVIVGALIFTTTHILYKREVERHG